MQKRRNLSLGNYSFFSPSSLCLLVHCIPPNSAIQRYSPFKSRRFDRFNRRRERIKNEQRDRKRRDIKEREREEKKERNGIPMFFTVRLWRGCVREVPTEPIKRRQTCRRENTQRGRRKIGGSRFPALCLRRGKMSRVETISLGFLRVARAPFFRQSSFYPTVTKQFPRARAARSLTWQ